MFEIRNPLRNAFERLKLPFKLSDCQEKDPAQCEVFLVEGESAGGPDRAGGDFADAVAARAGGEGGGGCADPGDPKDDSWSMIHWHADTKGRIALGW